MATLTIVRKPQRIYQKKPVSIYLNQQKIGVIQNGSPVTFQIDEGNHLLMPGTSLFRGQAALLDTSKVTDPKLELSVHPAVQLLNITMAVSMFFIAMVFILFADRLKAIFIGLLLIPLALLLVLGMIFLRKYFFVLRNTGE